MKKEICKNCVFYKAAYTRGFFKFWLEKQGLCIKHEKIFGEKERCEFCKLSYKDHAVSPKMLDIAIEDIKALQKIYGE